MQRYRWLTLKVVALFLTAGLLTGCDQQGLTRLPEADAVAILMPTQGNAVAGTMTFYERADGVRLVAAVSGLSPGAHGVHVHEFGDCRADDGASAGAHFNPLDQPHGAPGDAARHIGDLGNLVADEQGTAQLDMLVAGLMLDGENSIIGRSIVVHASEDDYTTQPHGAAGGRLACGVIGVALRR